MARIVSSGKLVSAPLRVPADFYRQEFIRHRECLALQRECFSERAISDADQALTRILGQLEQLCACDDADRVMAGLLRTFNAVTGLSGWCEPKQLH